VFLVHALNWMEVDGKPLMGMPPPVPIVHCCICYLDNEGHPKGRGFCLSRRGVCVASGIVIKNSLSGVTPRVEESDSVKGGAPGGRGFLGAQAHRI